MHTDLGITNVHFGDVNISSGFKLERLVCRIVNVDIAAIFCYFSKNVARFVRWCRGPSRVWNIYFSFYYWLLVSYLFIIECYCRRSVTSKYFVNSIFVLSTWFCLLQNKYRKTVNKAEVRETWSWSISKRISKLTILKYKVEMTT